MRYIHRLEYRATLLLRYLYILLYSEAITKDRDPQIYFLYKPRSFSLRIPLSEQNQVFSPLYTIDEIIFY